MYSLMRGKLSAFYYTSLCLNMAAVTVVTCVAYFICEMSIEQVTY